jgi:hypothetical protein
VVSSRPLYILQVRNPRLCAKCFSSFGGRSSAEVYTGPYHIGCIGSFCMDPSCPQHVRLHEPVYALPFISDKIILHVGKQSQERRSSGLQHREIQGSPRCRTNESSNWRSPSEFLVYSVIGLYYYLRFIDYYLSLYSFPAHMY